MDEFILNITSVGDSLFYPRFLEEEEEEELPNPNLLKKAEIDLLEALREWVSKRRRKNYKYIGIFLNTEVSELEKAFKSYIKKCPQIFRDESGASLLILHDYMNKQDIFSKRVSSIVYEYVERLNIPLLSLPAILLFPTATVLQHQKKPDTKSLLISIKEGKENWKGEINEYFTLFFRSLFDAVNSLSIFEKNSILHLEKNFKRKFKEQLYQSQIPENLQQTLKGKNEHSFFTMVTTMTIVISVGLYTILFLPSALSWTWLLEHPHKLGLQMSGVLILAGICWAVIDNNKDRKFLALGSVVIATLVTMVQLL